MGLKGSNYNEKLIKLIHCNLEFECVWMYKILSGN